MTRTRSRPVAVESAQTPGGRLPGVLEGFFDRRGWTPWDFQRRAWSAFAAGRSGLIHVPTGAGKTYAAYFGPVAEVVGSGALGTAGRAQGGGLRILYITPLRAVARDIERALRLPVDEAGLGLRVESRTGDTGSLLRARQKQRLPEVLVTTPESLSLMLTWPNAPALFGGLVGVIVDEWHELLSSKRGTQVELALARVRRWAPNARTWALSATLANLEDAARAAVGVSGGGRGEPVVISADMPRPVEIQTLLPESVETMPWAGHLGLSMLPRLVAWLEGAGACGLPATVEAPEGVSGDPVGKACGSVDVQRADGRAPPAPLAEPCGAPPPHAVEEEAVARGGRDRPVGLVSSGTARRVDVWADRGTTLVFVNTRSQCERWFHALMAVRPEWESVCAIHHGSIDRGERERVEAGLKDGSISLVVATSSLDLGVDFSPVERVVQIGSPKGVARLMQRAGRSGHRPGETARVLCVPTHALEIVEVAAVRSAIASGRVEARVPERGPIDVLAQHMVTCALGGGFIPDDLFAEVRSASAYTDLTREAFDWALSLVREGGGTLGAYPEFRKVEADEGGRQVVRQPRVGQLHRLNVGTIVGEATVDIAFINGRRLGSIEENFVAGLREGQRFYFAGRTLEFVRMHDMSALVRPARGKTNLTPIWGGTRLPISESMSESMRTMLGRAAMLVDANPNPRGVAGFQPATGPDQASDLAAGWKPAAPETSVGDPPELLAAMPVLAIQSRVSHLPADDELLIEVCETREGRHAFVFPFEGRLVHAGLAAILALRLARLRKASVTISANDYGLELLSERGFPFEELLTPTLFDPRSVVADSVEALNMGELAKRQFREIARVAGLVFPSYPGARKGARQVQASASLIYDVYRDFDPDNPLMVQARREVLERQFEEGRLGRTMSRMASIRHVVRVLDRPTPLSLPLVIERESGRLSSKGLLERVEQIVRSWRG